jgi:hypothetical protein
MRARTTARYIDGRLDFSAPRVGAFPTASRREKTAMSVITPSYAEKAAMIIFA